MGGGVEIGTEEGNEAGETKRGGKSGDKRWQRARDFSFFSPPTPHSGLGEVEIMFCI